MVVMLLGDRELSVTEMMELLDLSDRKHFREMYLDPAIAAGVVEMTIPGAPRSPKQKYRRVRKFSSGSDLQKTLVGNGWKHVASYEIKQDGSCETEEYYSSRYGVSPHYYYFENENTLYNLCYSLADAGRLVKTEHKWAYSDNETLIVIDPQVSAVDHPDCIQIIGKDGNRIWITERIAGRYVDDKYMPVYVVAQYDKMTEEKLNDLLSEAGIK